MADQVNKILKKQAKPYFTIAVPRALLLDILKNRRRLLIFDPGCKIQVNPTLFLMNGMSRRIVGVCTPLLHIMESTPFELIEKKPKYITKLDYEYLVTLNPHEKIEYTYVSSNGRFKESLPLEVFNFPIVNYKTASNIELSEKKSLKIYHVIARMINQVRFPFNFRACWKHHAKMSGCQGSRSEEKNFFLKGKNSEAVFFSALTTPNVAYNSGCPEMKGNGVFDFVEYWGG
jgi:hypothetical protein